MSATNSDRSGTRSRRAGALALLVLALGMTWSGHAIEPADSVLVVKTERRLYLIRNGERYASFPATFGSNSRGHKQEEGDGRTPEGRYVLDYKNANSAYHLSIHVSYPNERDIAAARKRGVSPGGDIMVHGQKAGFEWLGALTRHVNWTEGCIALSNEDMATVWNAVSPGTPIEIRP